MRKSTAEACRKELKSILLFPSFGQMPLRVMTLLICLPLVLSLSACWSKRELDSLAIVLGTAFDKGNEPDTLELTAQVVKASDIKSGGTSSKGSGQAVKAYANIHEVDKSALSVVRKVTHKLSRRLYFPHNQIIIFSSELAKTDIAEGLDVFMRDYESRMNVYILISRGKASEILAEEIELEKLPAIHIAHMMENQKSNSETTVVTLRDFAVAILSGSTAPIAPIVELYETDGVKKAELNGTAVFKKGKLVGEFNKAQTRGLVLVTDKADSSAMTVDTKWGQVVLEFMHTRSTLKPVMAEDGRIRMALKIKADGFVQSNETTHDMANLENIDMLKKLAVTSIRADITSALMQARSLSADVFGFGESIRQNYPGEWDKIKDNWDLAFSEIELDTSVEVTLRSTSGLKRPIVSGGANQ